MKKKTKTKTVDPQRSEAAATLGKMGGSAGKGEAKKRDPRHYSVTLVEARRKAKTKRQLGA